MRTILITQAIIAHLTTQAGAWRGKLCDYDWWKTATTADLKSELDM